MNSLRIILIILYILDLALSLYGSMYGIVKPNKTFWLIDSIILTLIGLDIFIFLILAIISWGITIKEFKKL